MKNELFVSNLVARRHDLKLTQEDASKLLGIKRSKLGSYEEGRAQPDTMLLSQIFKVYRVSNTIEFMSGNYVPETPLTEIQIKYLRLSDRDKRIVDSVLS